MYGDSAIALAGETEKGRVVHRMWPTAAFRTRQLLRGVRRQATGAAPRASGEQEPLHSRQNLPAFAFCSPQACIAQEDQKGAVILALPGWSPKWSSPADPTVVHGDVPV